MYQGKRSAFLLLLAGLLVSFLGLVACGGGGSSSGGGTLPQTSIAPTAVLDGWTPADATLLQYKVYTFAASATDPNIGGAITEFHWDFGDGTTKVTPVVLIGGKATTTAAYSYVASGTPILSVLAKNAAGLLSPAITKTLTVDAAPSPLTASFVTPSAAVSINPSLGGSVSVTFTVNVVNTGTGTVSASGIQLDPGDATATQTAATSIGSGNWTITVTYPAASAIGSRTATPTLKVVDSNGVSSTSVTGPVITVRTVSAVDNPPVITLVATPKIVAGINSTYQNVAIDFVATATDPDGDTLTYTWTFGDTGNKGDVAATQAASALLQSHTYTAAGVYPVTFTANDGRGSVGIKSITLNLNILANGAPTLAVAQVPSTQPYANVPITFTATVTDPNSDAVTLTWDFGDGSAVVTGQNPVIHSFAAAGSTLVTVTADDLKGGVTTWTSTLVVLANRPPVSQLTTATKSLFQNKSYAFTATATDPDAGDSVAQYQWDFGDGTAILTTTVGSASHTYASTFAGNASVRVRAVDSRGSTGDYSPAVVFPVVATSLPTGAFLNPAGSATYNTELSSTGVVIAYIVSMTNPNGTGFLPVTSLTFDPGEAAATATVLSQTANGDGTYTYQVRYKPAAAVGSRVVVPSVIATDLQGITGLLKAGGPVTINTQAVNTPPVITFTSASTPAAGTNATWQGVAFTFSGTATDADSDPLTYTVTFGDTGGAGNIATTPVATGGAITASHTYSTAGVYTATLTVSDGRTNGTKTITLNMNVIANAAPTVSIANTPAGTSQYANVPILFTATVADANGDPTTLTWNFGDGSSPVTGQNPVTHSFAAAGTTTVKATADDGKGGVTTTSLVLTVLPNLPPVSKVTTASGNLYQSKAYTFTATATDPDPTDTVAQYQWDFGDASAIQNTAVGSVSHTYATSFVGTANVRVRAVDNHGSTGDYSPAVPFTVVATSLPVVAFVSPGATVKNVDLGPSGTVDQAFTISVTNPQKTSGATDPLPIGNIVFSPNDALAAVLPSPVNNGGGSYTFTVRYTGAAAAGTRTSTPSAYATDSYGIQGLATSGPLMTITTLGANHTPTITITDPATATSSAYTSKPISFGFTLMDADNDPVTYTVDWGDGSATTSATPTGNFVTGVAVALAHTYADAYTASSKSAVITVNATDNRSANATAVAQTRTFTVTFNALPTASITSPQDSGSAPTGYTPNPLPADTVVVPLNGKLAFVGASTLPGSQDTVTTAWSLPGGVPSSHSGDSTGDVIFAGTAGVITPNLVTYTVTDAFGRSVSKTKTVLVDGVNSQQFLLSFQYRQKSDNNGTTTLTPATTALNGLGAPVQIFQDGQSNTYNVQDQTQLTGAKATVSIPVRSDLPFYIKIPGFSGALDGTTYLMRIPNAPTGAFADASLVATPTADSKFSFQNASAPYNPSLQVVTAQGFAAESATAPQRKLNGYTDLVIGTIPVNERWLDRLSVPTTDATGAFPWTQSSNAVGTLNAIPAYQLFAEWPTLLITRKTGDLIAAPTLETGVADPTTSAGTHDQLGFVLDYPTYTVGTLTHGDTFSAFSMQAFRVPAGVTDPYQLSPAWQSATAELANPAVNVHSGLNPVPVGSGVTTFFQTLVNGAPGSTPLAGGIASLPLPYDPNDPDRTPLALASATTRTYSGIRSIFAFSEYLWSTVWARPLVLNSARPYFMDSLSLNTYPYFRYSNPGYWPSATGISPDNSAFNLTARGGGVFDASAPVAVGGGTAPATGVGRFFWTAYTPSYSGDASQGQVISRTWLADDTTKQTPTAFSAASATGDATSAFGFMPPQDTIVDKRGRTAAGALSGATLGGYRVTWYNATKDASGNPVPPDFWVVELAIGSTRSHFMLPGSYPAGTQSVSDAIMTDARVYLPSGNAATAGPATGDKVGPGYCWFDIPVELRPTSATGVTLTVFGVKSILKNHPVAAARALNRPDWMDAIKTATATIKVLSAGGSDLGYAHKVPFNYAWDIVVVNGPATYVAP